MSVDTSTKTQTAVKRRPWWLNINMVGVLLVLFAFGVSIKRVFSIREVLEGADGSTVLRISHWQLELGYRDALQYVIDMYEKEQAAKGKKIRILQMPVTEKVYGPWINTNLIAGTAPDLVLMGHSSMLTSEQYLARYFRPMTDLVDLPNPYNKGNELEGVAWRETYFDGMRGAYNIKLQDYFMLPTASYTMRIFYNKKMFKEATGSEAAPKTFGELMAICQKISDHAARTNQKILPIAGSKYSYLTFVGRYSTAFTASMEKELDVNLDGTVAGQEVYEGFMRGAVDMNRPNMKALFELLRELSVQFGPGFIGKDRQTAAFEFVQQRAGMIATGSWDAQSLFAQAEQSGFDVGIFDFPLPARGEKYAEHVVGKSQEATAGAAGGIGLYKYSRNSEQALDFLQFLTSKRINQIHMERTNWIPVVRGTEPKGKMAVFAPDPIGFTTSISPYYGNDMSARFNGELQSFLSGDSGYGKLADVVDSGFKDPLIGGDWAWCFEYNELVKQVRMQERSLAAHVVRDLLLKASDAQDKHRQIMLQQLKVNNAQTMKQRFEALRNIPLSDVEKRRGG